MAEDDVDNYKADVEKQAQLDSGRPICAVLSCATLVKHTHTHTIPHPHNQLVLACSPWFRPYPPLFTLKDPQTHTNRTDYNTLHRGFTGAQCNKRVLAVISIF